MGAAMTVYPTMYCADCSLHEQTRGGEKVHGAPKTVIELQ